MKDTDLAGSGNRDSILSFVRSLDFPYFAGAIYPSEMAFFLLQCEKAEIECIIESGRGDGYSTGVIAAYGKARDIRIISIDFEADSARAALCRQRLARFRDIELVSGDAFYEVPRLLRSVKGAVALLIDGPKSHNAVYLSSAAAAYGSVKLVSHHNVHPESTGLYSHFSESFPDTQRLEDSGLFQSEPFHGFRVWERSITENYQGPGRELEKTSLVVSILPRVGPDLGYLHKSSLRHRLNKMSLYWWWRLGRPGATVAPLVLRGTCWLKSKIYCS